MPAEKSKNFRGTLARLWELLGTERPLLVAVVLLVIGGSSSEKSAGGTYVEIKDGIVTDAWRD